MKPSKWLKMSRWFSRKDRLKLAYSIFFALIALTFLSFADTVAAATVIESQGPGGYGWQQVYTNTAPFVRLTGSADRQYYDWGYKNITITGRIENYWATDCGWWYVTDPATIQNITIWDNASDLVYSFTSAQTAQKGLVNRTYAWGSGTAGNGKDDPGEWTVNVTNSSAVVASFKIYVRGQLNVTFINAVQDGDTVTVNATVEDNAGNNVNTSNPNTPTVTAYVSGPGFASSSEMTWSSPYWTEDFELQKPGDYYITVKASDDHTYWIDGRGSNKTAVTGTFPYAFGGYGAPAGSIVMILLALLLMRSGRKPVMCLLILIGGGIMRGVT